MEILSYLIAFSLTIISVAKTTELFFESDKSLSKIQQNFIKETRSHHQNEKGSLTMAAISLVLIISAMFYFYISKMSIEYKEALYRKDSYLCFKFLNQKTQNYINEMAKYNIALRAAFAAKSSVVNGVSGEVVFQGIRLARNSRHLIYLGELAKNKYCKTTEALGYLKNLPFKTALSGLLETNFDETSKVSKAQWTNTIYKNPQGIRLKKSFCLKSSYSIKGAFFPDLKINSEEIPLADLSSWRCLSGAASSSS